MLYQKSATCCPSVDLVGRRNIGLRRLSTAKSAPTTVSEIFMKAVRDRGRMHEAGLMASFKLRTMRLFQDMGKLPMMLWKGKMPLYQSATPGRAERVAIFERAAQAEKGGKQ